MTRKQQLVLLGLAALVAIAAVVIALATSGGGDGKDDVVTSATVAVVDGKPQGGVRTFRFRKGATIDLTVDAAGNDSDDEVHFHGYDVEKELPAGGSVRFEIPATTDGVFEVELHHSGAQLAKVEVVP